MRILYWDAAGYPSGRYLHYLSLLPYQFLVPQGVRLHRKTKNITCVPLRQLRSLSADCAIFSSYRSFFYDRHRFLPEALLRVPTVFVEHHSPRREEEHPIHDPNVLVVHAHPLHDLVWKMRATPSVVIEYGVPSDKFTVQEDHALFEHGCVRVPNSSSYWQEENSSLLASISRRALLDFAPMRNPVDRRYRYVLEANAQGPWLSLLECMGKGVAPVCIASTAMAGLIENGSSGFMGATSDELAGYARSLQRDRRLAVEMGQAAHQLVREHCGLRPFLGRWNRLLRSLAGMNVRTGPRRTQPRSAYAASRAPE